MFYHPSWMAVASRASPDSLLQLQYCEIVSPPQFMAFLGLVKSLQYLSPKSIFNGLRMILLIFIGKIKTITLPPVAKM